jgi:hypothetical protein
VNSNPIAKEILAELELTDEQTTSVQEALDGMVRKRSAGNGPAVLTRQINIGIGTKSRPLRPMDDRISESSRTSAAGTTRSSGSRLPLVLRLSRAAVFARTGGAVTRNGSSAENRALR